MRISANNLEFAVPSIYRVKCGSNYHSFISILCAHIREMHPFF